MQIKLSTSRPAADPLEAGTCCVSPPVIIIFYVALPSSPPNIPLDAPFVCPGNPASTRLNNPAHTQVLYARDHALVVQGGADLRRNDPRQAARRHQQESPPRRHSARRRAIH